MTTNLRSRLRPGTASRDRSHLNITENVPQQTHFSAEGVQMYSPQEIKAMKDNYAMRHQAQEGEYIQPKVYNCTFDELEIDKLLAEKQKTDINWRAKVARKNRKIAEIGIKEQQKQALDTKIHMLKQHKKPQTGSAKERAKPQQQEQNADKSSQKQANSFQEQSEAGDNAAPAKREQLQKTRFEEGDNLDGSFEQLQMEDMVGDVFNQSILSSREGFNQRLSKAVAGLTGSKKN